MKIKIRKKDKKFRPYSTSVNDWYFGKDWLTREEMVIFLKDRAKERHKAELKEIEENFPNGYWTTDNRCLFFKNPKELK